LPISIDPQELADLICGTRAIHQALGGRKNHPARRTAHNRFRGNACVVALRDIQPGERLNSENIWVNDRAPVRLRRSISKKMLGRVVQRRVLKDRQ